ncbi:MAG TPA: hypothetical protein ENJ33_07875 [Thiothrix sp.]|nr:hypothetical protein [Thiothrix sp.]
MITITIAQRLSMILTLITLSVAPYCQADNASNKNFSITTTRQIAYIISNKHYLKPRFDHVYQQAKNATSLRHYLKTLDKYSRYRPVEQVKFAQRRSKKHRIDIGADLLIDANNVLAVPLINSPLLRAGMKKPVYIQSINGQTINYNDFKSYQFLGYLRSGQKITVKTRNTHKTYNIRATQVNNQTVHYKKIKQYGVITIRRFTEQNVSAIKKALMAAKKSSSIIIDLRHNPGGDLYATTDTLSFLLKKDKNITYLKQGNTLINLQTLKGRLIKNKRLIILSSRFTASSAEVFIRALKYYYPKVTLVGEETSGKCLAQENFQLKNGALLHLSVYNLLTPDKKYCQDKPIQPDRVINDIELMDIKNIIHIQRKIL